MARLTFSQIVTQGGVLGGNDAVATWIGTKLKAWLRKHAAAWPWPFLITQETTISFPAGNTDLIVGAGQGGITDQISRIFSPIYYRADGFSTRGKAPIREMVGGPSSSAIGNIDDSSQKGPPGAFVYIPSYDANMKQIAILSSYPSPDKDYLLSFACQIMPDDPDDSTIPWYPNEMTLIQAAKCAAIEYDNSNSNWYLQEEKTLAAMVVADRDAYGGTASFGDTLQLDDAVFPTEDLTGTINKMGW